MTKDEWKALSVGDYIRNKIGANGYQVVTRVTSDNEVVFLIERCLLASNPDEWDLAAKAHYEVINE